MKASLVRGCSQSEVNAVDGILIKVFATALALSQVATRPDDVKMQFDPVRDQAEVVQLLQGGCAHIRKAFDVEDIPRYIKYPAIFAGGRA